MVFTTGWQAWNNTDGGTGGDSEESNKGTGVDIVYYFFLVGTFCTLSFILLWQVYLRGRDAGSTDAEIPEPEVVNKSVGERRKELLAGFEEHKVQRVSKPL
jgi:hypothetical protein